MSNTVTWSGSEFTVYDPSSTTWNAKAGIYIFTGIISTGRWKAYYIGQTDDFSSRIPGHEKWAPAVRLGASHIHARVVPLQASRDTLESQLIQACQPPLNVQGR